MLCHSGLALSQKYQTWTDKPDTCRRSSNERRTCALFLRLVRGVQALIIRQWRLRASAPTALQPVAAVVVLGQVALPAPVHVTVDPIARWDEDSVKGKALQAVLSKGAKMPMKLLIVGGSR